MPYGSRMFEHSLRTRAAARGQFVLQKRPIRLGEVVEAAIDTARSLLDEKSHLVMFSQLEGTPDRAAGGLGIGLALSKNIIDLHGGTMEVTSAGPGAGSEFTVRLPLPGSNPPRPQ